jgi:hypothetical protein
MSTRHDGRIVSLDPGSNTGLIRDETNEIRDFRRDDLVRWTEFARLNVGDTVSFEPKKHLGRNTAIKVEKGQSNYQSHG